jgi:hypothetical protein
MTDPAGPKLTDAGKFSAAVKKNPALLTGIPSDQFSGDVAATAGNALADTDLTSLMTKYKKASAEERAAMQGTMDRVQAALDAAEAQQAGTADAAIANRAEAFKKQRDAFEGKVAQQEERAAAAATQQAAARGSALEQEYSQMVLADAQMAAQSEQITREIEEVARQRREAEAAGSTDTVRLTKLDEQEAKLDTRRREVNARRDAFDKEMRAKREILDQERRAKAAADAKARSDSNQV